MADQRPHSREFSQERRDELGLAVQRAREGAGHAYRPSFARLAGSPLSVRSLLKLEKGEPVGASVYEAAGRTLARYYQDWSVDTPLEILRGAEPPPGEFLEGLIRAEVTLIDPEDVDDSNLVRTGAPDPEGANSLEEYLRATIKHLVAQGLPRESIIRALADVATEYDQVAERNAPGASGNGGGTSG